ncbi:hypothetical protein C2G38_2037244 [Gigaspora rosea]|uniref:Uncharacterized protein n=1 Tax=Gigaspora rosea TaxID=44941 RepID=A0A397V6E6_9GLOM|nr:hypothetical protein C2G38_2037244 [Gigaspora rosea]
MDKAYFGEMILHALTPEYLNWHAKLVDSPSHLTDKIRSSLYRAYMEETGLDLWIKSENLESSQIEEGNYTPQNCVIKISKFPEEKNPEAKCPICKEVHTHRESYNRYTEHTRNLSVPNKTAFISQRQAYANMPLNIEWIPRNFRSLLRLRKIDRPWVVFLLTWKEIYASTVVE